MNLIDFNNSLKDLEKSLNFKNFEIEGINMWPVIRIQLGLSVLSKIDNNKENISSFWDRLKKKISVFIFGDYTILNFLFDLFKQNKYFEKDYLFLTDTSSKRFKYKNAWYDVYVDSLIENENYNDSQCCILESNQRFLKSKNPLRNTHEIQHILILNFVKSFFSKKPKFTDKFLREYNKIYDFYKNTLYINFLISKTDIVKEWSIINNLKNYFLKILHDVSPKKIFMIHYNGYDGMALCLAANQLKISTYDIQHGVQGNYHPAYNYYKVPFGGFNLIPKNFLVWSKKEKELIERGFNNRSHHRVKAYGNTLLNSFKIKSDISKYYDKVFIEKFKNINDRKIILLSLCWGESISSKMISLIESSDQIYFFLIRIHPSTTKKEKFLIVKKLNKLKSKNFDFKESSNLPIHCLLRNINFHITSVSSIVLEALEFGIRSIVTSQRGKTYYQNQIADKKVFFSNNLKKILDLIALYLNKSFNKLAN